MIPKTLRSVMPSVAAMSRGHTPGSCAMADEGLGRGWKVPLRYEIIVFLFQKFIASFLEPA
jgi:hypothetical protein